MKKTILAFAISLLAAGSVYAAEKQAERTDFRSETIYFVMTDRFVDGDSSNNNIYGDEFVPGNLRYYQGGDFKGLIDNLDYIKGMGFTAIWITPPVKQPEGRYVNTSNTYDAAGYHGYWAYDFSKIDPHLESQGATYQDLIDAVHAKGMKIIQDVVVNHAHGGDVNRNVKWYNQRGVVKGLGRTYDYWNDKRNWFNHDGNVIADLLDFNDSNPQVLKWFTKIYKKYQKMGVDAFRLDTVTWVDKDFWIKFVEKMHKNKKNFFIFGEVWTDNEYDKLASYTRLADGDSLESGMSVLDMPLSALGDYGTMEKIFKGGNYADATAIFENDSKYKNPTFLVTYLDNHDRPRFNSPDSPAYEQQYKDALNFYFLSRGIPCVYYGTEAQMVGGNEPDNRAMLGEEGIKAAKTGVIYAHLKKLNRIRHRNEVLQKGRQTFISATRNSYVFRRDYLGQTVFVFLNKGENEIKLGADITPGTYKDLFNKKLITFEQGKPSEVTVQPHSAVVLYSKVEEPATESAK